VPPHSSREYSPTSTTRTAPRLVLGSDERPDRQVGKQYVVDLGLDVGQHTVRHRRGRREVEPEPPGVVLRPRLGGLLTDRPPDRSVDQVRCRVRPRQRLASLDVYRRETRRAEHGGTGHDLPAVDHQVSHRSLGVVHLDDRAVGEHDPAVVSELAAAFGVERRAVQRQLDLVAFGG
jgi:hypothetical protein